MKNLILLFLGWITTFTFAQKKNANEFSLYLNVIQETVQIQELKFYISSISFLRQGKEVWKEKNSFHLIDIDKIESLEIHLKTKKSLDFDQISFNLGIDSTTNSKGVKGGDLDPTKGMYWTWQSGYINFKCEGISANNQPFQFHLGGFTSPYNACQKVNLQTTETKNITIDFDIENWFKKLDLKETHHIMSPSIEAVDLSKKLVKSIRLKN